MNDAPGVRALCGHGAVLLLALVACMGIVDAHGWYSVDEGAAIIQARQLSRHGSWATDHPLEAVDPDGTGFGPRTASRVQGGGYAPYAQHPAYPWVLSLLDRVGGIRAQVLLSVVGTVAASMGAALVAGAVRPRLAIPVLYGSGLLSPLLFDSFLVIAHTVAAALVGWAAWFGLRHSWTRRRLSINLVASCGLLLVATLMRSEVPLLIAAAALVLGLAGVRDCRRRALAGSGALGLTAAAGVGLDRLLRQLILGSSIPLPGSSGSSGSTYWADRFDGFVTTVLRGSYGVAMADLLLVVAATLFGVAAVLIRRADPVDRRVAGGLAIAGAIATLIRVLAAPLSSVPGLAVAFPLLWVGLVVRGRPKGSMERGVLYVAGTFALAVLATQYAIGGGLEWGWRYTAVVLPVVIPWSARGLASLADRSEVAVRVMLVAVFVSALSLSALMLMVQRNTNRHAADFVEALELTAVPSRFGAAAPSALADDERPVIVTAEFAVPQLAWPLFDDVRWLRIEPPPNGTPAAPDDRIAAMADEGLDRLTFVSRDFERDRPILGDPSSWSVEVERAYLDLKLLVIAFERPD